MNKAQFLQELEKQSKYLSSTEKEDLLDFYQDLLDNAQDELETIKGLPSPGEIVANLEEKCQGEGVSSEKGSVRWRNQRISLWKQLGFMFIYMTIMVFFKDCYEFSSYDPLHISPPNDSGILISILMVSVVAWIFGGVGLFFGLKTGKMEPLTGKTWRTWGILSGILLLWFYISVNVLAGNFMILCDQIIESGQVFLGFMVYSWLLPVFFMMGFLPYLLIIMPILNVLWGKKLKNS